MYVELLESAGNLERFTDLVISTMNVKRKTASVEEFTGMCFQRLLTLMERVFNIYYDKADELLGYLYDIHLKCKAYLSTKGNFSRQLESMMLRFCLPEFIDSEVGTKRNASMDIDSEDASAPISVSSSFTNTSFTVVREYCSKRWPDRLKRQSSIGTTRENSIPRLQQQQQQQQQTIPVSPNTLTKRQRVLKGLAESPCTEVRSAVNDSIETVLDQEHSIASNLLTDQDVNEHVGTLQREPAVKDIMESILVQVMDVDESNVSESSLVISGSPPDILILADPTGNISIE